MREHLAIATVLALLLALPASAQNSGAKRLYRWVDANGKVHYSDALPPEAVNQARAEISASSGLVRDTVDRALSDAERLDAQAREAAAVRAAEAAARQRAVDEVELASYATEVDLDEAFAERRASLEESIRTQDEGLAAQVAALADVLERAGDEELAGRPVPATLQASITDQRAEILKQEALRLQRAGERVALEEELARLHALHQERQQRMQERGLAPTPPAPPVTPAD